MDEEINTPFHEHVFLDHRLEDFPEKGPIRVFMELVLLGLSKNSHMTVKEKHAHIDWFKQYFDDKKDVIDKALQDQEEELKLKNKAQTEKEQLGQ